MALLAGRGCWAMPMLWVVWVCVYAGHVWVGTRLSPSAVCCSACVGGTLADTGRLGCGLEQGLGLNYAVYVRLCASYAIWLMVLRKRMSDMAKSALPMMSSARNGFQTMSMPAPR